MASGCLPALAIFYFARSPYLSVLSRKSGVCPTGSGLARKCRLRALFGFSATIFYNRGRGEIVS